MQLFDTNFVIAAEPMDPAFVGTPQEYFDHIAERMSIKSTSPLYTVVVSDSAPLSNQGFLLLGGLKLYVWNENLSQYQPADITDSLYAPTSGKYVFTVDAGVLTWKVNTAFASWIGLGIGDLTAGPAGTISYSNGAINAWGPPDTALPVKSVAVTKLKCDSGGADDGKVATGQADGSVAWETPVTFLHGTTSEYAVPAAGGKLDLPHSLGAMPSLVRVVAVCQAPIDGYLEDDEIDISGISADLNAGDEDSVAYTVSSSASKITVAANTADNGQVYVAKAGGLADWGVAQANFKLKAYVFRFP